jgi:hypothetical protein
MTPETVGAVASVGTFLVIAVTAFAALVQLRHIRAANQLTGLLPYVARWESDAVQSATNFVETELSAKLKEDNFRETLWLRNPDRREHPELRVADWCEQMGSIIKYDMVSEEQYLDLAAGYVASMWDQLREVVAIRRAATNLGAEYENFEFLAVRAKAFGAAHPSGNYPRGAERLLPDEEWKKLADDRRKKATKNIS